MPTRLLAMHADGSSFCEYPKLCPDLWESDEMRSLINLQGRTQRRQSYGSHYRMSRCHKRECFLEEFLHIERAGGRLLAVTGLYCEP